jgi:hypothetical protein
MALKVTEFHDYVEYLDANITSVDLLYLQAS